MLTLLTLSLVGIILQPIETTYQTEKVYHSEHQESVLCSCVDYVRQLRPDLPSMDASSFSVSTTTIRKGDAVKMRYPSGAWHLAYASDVVGDQVLLMHANVVPCQESSEWRSVHDTRILGSI